MSREDPFLTVGTTLTGRGEGQRTTSIINRAGMQIVADFYDQMVLGGFTYHIQLGTEDAGIASTTSIDDELVWALADNPAGKVMIPVYAAAHPSVWSTSTIVLAMLEIDKDKARWSSGGTAYVPANLRTDDPNAASGAFYVGTDIAATGKSAVPNSVELARMVYAEDNIGTAIGSDFQNTPLYTVKRDPMVMLVDASSVLLHFGAASADTTGYGSLDFIQADKGVFVAT